MRVRNIVTLLFVLAYSQQLYTRLLSLLLPFDLFVVSGSREEKSCSNKATSDRLPVTSCLCMNREGKRRKKNAEKLIDCRFILSEKPWCCTIV